MKSDSYLLKLDTQSRMAVTFGLEDFHQHLEDCGIIIPFDDLDPVAESIAIVLLSKKENPQK